MKRFLFISLVLCLVSNLFAQDNLSALIPMPNKISVSSQAPLKLQGKWLVIYRPIACSLSYKQ